MTVSTNSTPITADELADDLAAWDRWVERRRRPLETATEPLTALTAEERALMLATANEGRKVPLRSLRALEDYEVIDAALSMWAGRRDARITEARRGWTAAANEFSDAHGRGFLIDTTARADVVRDWLKRLHMGRVTLEQAMTGCPPAVVPQPVGGPLFPDEWVEEDA